MAAGKHKDTGSNARLYDIPGPGTLEHNIGSGYSMDSVPAERGGRGAIEQDGTAIRCG